MATGTIGSISHGTLREEDLLSAFTSELSRLDDDNVYAALVKEAEEIDPESEHVSEIINDLSDALNDFAPPYCYFGSTEGDGADFGFWPSIDSLEDAVRDGEVLKVSDLSEVPSDYIGEVALVNDHGNVTFGHTVAQFVEDWSVV